MGEAGLERRARKRSKTGATTRARVRLVRSVLARSFRAASATRAKPKISDATSHSLEIKTSWRLGKSTATAHSPRMLSKTSWCTEPHPATSPPPVNTLSFKAQGKQFLGGPEPVSPCRPLSEALAQSGDKPRVSAGEDSRGASRLRESPPPEAGLLPQHSHYSHGHWFPGGTCREGARSQDCGPPAMPTSAAGGGLLEWNPQNTKVLGHLK